MKFLSIFAVIISALGLAASPDTRSDQFAIHMTVEENGAAIADERMVVYPGKQYMIDLTSSYKLYVEIAPDTAAAA